MFFLLKMLLACQKVTKRFGQGNDDTDVLCQFFNMVNLFFVGISAFFNVHKNPPKNRQPVIAGP